MTTTPGEPGGNVTTGPNTNDWQQLLPPYLAEDSQTSPTPMLDPDWIETSPWPDAWSYRRT